MFKLISEARERFIDVENVAVFKNNGQTVCLFADLGSSLFGKSSTCVTFPVKTGLQAAFSFSFLCAQEIY